MHTVTIAARNYLSRAQALAESYRATNPGDKMTILLVDAEPGEFASTDVYRVATPADLPLAPDEFRQMAMIYNITELSTSIKPWALEMLLDEGADVAMYLDPDIIVYASMQDVARLGRTHGIVLTPHTDAPMPRDGLRPTEADIMGSGIYNLGFIAVGQQSRVMLRWWQERLRRDSVVAPHQMMFVDQRWIDLVPGYFSHTILRDPGYNVAYWNLDNRRLTRDGEAVRVNGVPLRFFHFSGYSPNQPWVLSKYVADNPRVVFSEHPVARELCDQYGALIGTTSPLSEASTSYRFSRFSDGTPVSDVVRRAYRQRLADTEKRGAPPLPIPFTGNDEKVVAWLREPIRPGGRMNRFLYALWEMRPDLVAAFPDPLGVHEAALISWAWFGHDFETEVIAALLPAKAPVEPVAVELTSDEPGVNLAGYFHAEMGVGEISRLLTDAVRHTGLPFNTITNRLTTSRQNARFEGAEGPVRYPVTVAAVNADQFPNWAREVGPRLRQDRHTIGMWAWETEDFTPSAEALALVDEIWAISRFGRRAIAAATSKPVYVVPLPVHEPPPHRPLDRDGLGVPDGPYFLFVFDYLSVFARKNPMGLISAFMQAFADGAGPTLVVKTINGEQFRSDRERLRMACIVRRDIILIEDYLDHADLSSLMGEASAYVSLHRAEGFGLTMAEAMARGVPVVATGYSGNLDFMSADNSLLVPYKRVKVGRNAGPYHPQTFWAEPDIDAAAHYLQWLYENPAEAVELGRRARASVLAAHSVEVTAAFVRERVEAAIMARTNVQTNSGPPPAVIGRAHSNALRRARHLIDTTPDLSTPSRAPRVAKMFRRVVFRALAHHDAHVNVRLNALADAVAQAEFETDRISQTVGIGPGPIDLARFQALPELSDSVHRLAVRIDSIGEELSVRDVLNEVRVAQLADERRRVTELQAELAAIRPGIKQAIESQPRVGEHLAGIESHLELLTDEVAGRLEQVVNSMDRLEQEQVARPYMSHVDALTVLDADGRTTFGYHSDVARPTADYAGFEDIFRGSEEFIAGRLKPYLPLLLEQAPIMDVGCGRGELLDLLRAEGVSAQGVDLDRSMVERCARRGLAVEIGDGVATLRSLDPGAMGAVTSIQVVEHLPVDLLRAMFEAARVALRPGGIFIAETVNPHSPSALKTFWVDLTHVRPLYPESLLMLAREVGFSAAEIMFPAGGGDLGEDLRACGEYALIAKA